MADFASLVSFMAGFCLTFYAVLTQAEPRNIYLLVAIALMLLGTVLLGITYD